MKLLIVPLLLAAIAAGFAIGRATAGSPPVESKSRPEPAAPSASPPASSSAAEVEALREKIAMQDAELRTLKQQAQNPPTAAAPADAPADAMAVPAELWSILKAGNKVSPKGEDKLKAMKLLGELKHEHAAFFIAKYRESEDLERRQTSLAFAMISGGPDSANFAAALAGDDGLDDDVRSSLLRTLSGTDDLPSRLVITDALSALGDRFLGSTSADDRCAAAGIFGLKPRDAATEGTLRTLADDVDERVRVAAVINLSRGATPETAAWLKAWQGRMRGSEWMQRKVDGVMEGLEGR